MIKLFFSPILSLLVAASSMACLPILYAEEPVPSEHAGQTIAEKKESFQQSKSDIDQEILGQLQHVNELLAEKHFELEQLYDQAFELYLSQASEEKYSSLLENIKFLKEEIAEIQKMWRLEIAPFAQNEEYALWHLPEANLQQLVMDYGTSDFVYVIPPNVGSIRVSLNSDLPIPKESWGECLDLILAQYGVGVRELNPYMRELYLLHNDPSAVKAIVDSVEQLDLFPSHSPLTFVLSPNTTDPRSDLLFLQKFSNPATTKVEIFGGKIFITASVSTIQELLKLYGFIKTGDNDADFQLVSLNKIKAKEIEMILNSAFHNGDASSEGATLKVIPLENLSHSIFLNGTKEEVKKALELINRIETQIEDPQEKTVFWYTVKHSDAEELAATLSRVYDLLIGNPTKTEIKKESPNREMEKEKAETLIISPTHLTSQSKPKAASKTTNDFIVDAKTGSIIMVVNQEALPKIKELLKKLDVPKKMIQIEVLLFEKKVSNQSKFGLNLLRLGASASKIASCGLKYGGVGSAGGILEFLISRNKSSGIPAYDLAYQFLLGQEDVQINASPSITTINQTPATFSIVNEISINSGADDDKSKVYHRAQYGITIQITPTINIDEKNGNGEECRFISLDTDITFDTTQSNENDRPDVTRRHIKNFVRIADGQTLILGGLRCKNIHDNKESIPFLGEIPGIGKLFSTTTMSESSTDMFIFITPKIIADPIEDAERLRLDGLKKRPGDIPEVLQELLLAKKREKRRLFEGSLTTLLGRERTSSSSPLETLKEYDGK